MINLKKAEEFHGHLGPYLVLGLLMGEYALERLKARRHFGMEIEARGLDKKPKSCLIDGLQLATGCTYGKSNIRKANGRQIRVIFRNLDNKKDLAVFLKANLVRELNALKGHRQSESFARKIFNCAPEELFKTK